MNVEIEHIDSDVFTSEVIDTELEEVEPTIYAEHIDDRDD